MNKYFSITISWRFALAAALPLMLVTVILTFYLVQTRHQDSQQQFEQTSEISTQYIGGSVELELYAGNTQELRETANSSDVPNLIGVTFLDKDRLPLASTTGFQTPEELIGPQLWKTFESNEDNRLYLQQEVHLTEIDVNDYSDDNSSETPLVGWVIASFDTTEIHQQQQHIVMTGISLGIIGLVLASALALALGRTIVNPVLQLTETVKHMEAGDLNARAKQASTQELARLAQGINLLAKSVADGRSNLEDKVHKATRTMEQALLDLREKNSELHQAREIAEAANQAKSDFLARMSHELRTPITAIQGFTRLLHGAELGDAERNYCTIINQSSGQLLNLIDDILAISRLQANAIEIAADPFNLIETLEQSVRQQALPAWDKHLELILDISPEVPSTVVGDHFRVAQIIINLITNAVKFTNTGHVRTRVHATPKEDLTELTIEISDTGIGIPPQSRDNLFQPFSQADTSITRSYGGTGLGLSIVQSLLDLMGGSIHLDSTEGVGTLFRISLTMPITAVEKGPSNIDARVGLLDNHPLSRQAVTNSLCRFVAELVVVDKPEMLPNMALDAIIVSLPSDAEHETNYQYLDSIRELTNAPLLVISANPETCRQQYCSQPQHTLKILDKPATQLSLHNALQQLICGDPEAPESVAIDNNSLSGLNVLIAEDNPFTREFLKTLLSREGAYCVTACNGVEAVAASAKEPFDIMLVDIHMPRKSGIETVSSIRADGDDNCTTPIIMITADVLQQEKLALKDAGITELLFKPVDEELLIKRILYHCKPGSSTPVLHRKLRDEIPTDQFFDEVNRLVEQVAKACRNGDLEGARDPVHQLLGVAGVFKLPEMEVKVASLHRAIKNHRHSQAITALEELQQECGRLAETITGC